MYFSIASARRAASVTAACTKERFRKDFKSLARFVSANLFVVARAWFSRVIAGKVLVICAERSTVKDQASARYRWGKIGDSRDGEEQRKRENLHRTRSLQHLIFISRYPKAEKSHFIETSLGCRYHRPRIFDIKEKADERKVSACWKTTRVAAGSRGLAYRYRYSMIIRQDRDNRARLSSAFLSASSIAIQRIGTIRGGGRGKKRRSWWERLVLSLHAPRVII